MFENGKLDQRPAKLPERLHMPTVADIVPGSVHWIDKDALWFDTEGEVWINQAAPLEYNDDDIYVSQFVRIIEFDEGTVVDWTSATDSDGNLKKVYRSSFQDHVDDEHFDIGEYKKAVAFISTKDELKDLKNLFKQTYGVKFNGRPTGSKSTKPKNKKTSKVKTD